uniref:ELMO domain-containing protein n=1 Tax=Heterorhabditis bacteriophora TaxID=37862 RepID=A0A1I7X6U6_HETBA
MIAHLIKNLKMMQDPNHHPDLMGEHHMDGDMVDEGKVDHLVGDVVTEEQESSDRNLQSAPISGRPSNFDDNSLKLLVESDPRLTIDEISQLHSSWSTVQAHGLNKQNGNFDTT